MQHTADWALLHHALAVVDAKVLHAPVRARIRSVLRQLASVLGQKNSDHSQEAAHLLNAHLTGPTSARLDPLPRIPPGAPN
ncbi:hypothetical protein ACWKT5_20585 [Streptomyces avermitilis]